MNRHAHYFYSKITIFPKGKTIDTTNLRPGELLRMDFESYNVDYIRGFTSMITLVCVKTTTVCIIHTASKQSPIGIILFMLTTLNNENHTCRREVVGGGGALEKLLDVSNLISDKFSIST